MLKKINEAEVTSTEGYRIKYGRDTLRYFLNCEPPRYVTIPIEDLGDPHKLCVYIDAASDWLEKDRIVSQLSPHDLKLITERIAQCLSFLNCSYSFQTEKC